MPEKKLGSVVSFKLDNEQVEMEEEVVQSENNIPESINCKKRASLESNFSVLSKARGSVSNVSLVGEFNPDKRM